jgi:hypothetical protein
LRFYFFVIPVFIKILFPLHIQIKFYTTVIKTLRAKINDDLIDTKEAALNGNQGRSEGVSEKTR